MAFGSIVQGPYTASHASHPQATLGVSPTTGNLVVVVHCDVAATSAPDSPLLTAVKHTQTDNSDDLAIYYRVVEGGDGTTYGGTSANTSAIILWEVEGPFEATPLDQTASDNGGSDTSTQTTGTTGTTTQADEYAVGAIGDRDTAGNASGWTNSFTEVGEVASAFLSAYAAARVLTATGTYSTTATLPTGGVGGRNWGAIATFKKTAAGTTLYFLDTAASGSNFGQIQVGGSAPSTATTATGWTVDTVGATNYALMAYASERASSVFSGTAQPAGNPDNSLGDCFRSTSTMSGDFATGVWTIAVPVIAVSAAAGQDGRVRVRLWKSANATGTSPTEITSGAVAGTTVTNLTTGAEQVSTVTTSSITGFSMANDYLFVQIAWEITGAAT